MKYSMKTKADFRKEISYKKSKLLQSKLSKFKKIGEYKYEN